MYFIVCKINKPIWIFRRSQKYLSVCFCVIIDQTEFIVVSAKQENIFLYNFLVINDVNKQEAQFIIENFKITKYFHLN